MDLRDFRAHPLLHCLLRSLLLLYRSCLFCGLVLFGLSVIQVLRQLLRIEVSFPQILSKALGVVALLPCVELINVGDGLVRESVGELRPLKQIGKRSVESLLRFGLGFCLCFCLCLLDSSSLLCLAPLAGVSRVFLGSLSSFTLGGFCALRRFSSFRGYFSFGGLLIFFAFRCLVFRRCRGFRICALLTRSFKAKGFVVIYFFHDFSLRFTYM